MTQSQGEHEEMTQTWLSQVRSEILTVVTKMADDLDVTPRSLVPQHQSFGERFCVHLILHGAYKLSEDFVTP
jgi:hypothetical protein